MDSPGISLKSAKLLVTKMEWLLIAWADPDQWLFVRSAAVRRIRAVADITRQFNPGARGGGAFPVLRGWCCRRGGLAP